MASSSNAGSGLATLTEEFQQWFETNSTNELIMYLADSNASADGTVKLELSFSDASTFCVRVGKEYPVCPTFKIDSAEKNMLCFCDHLTQYTQAHDGTIKLPALLSFAYASYDARAPTRVNAAVRQQQAMNTSEATAAGTRCSSGMGSAQGEDEIDGDGETSGSDMEYDMDEEDNEFDMPDDNSMFTTQFEIKCDVRKKRWLVKEKALRERLAKEKEEKKGDAKWKKPAAKLPAAAPKRQGEIIFDHDTAAFQILSNDMIYLWKTGKADGFEVDTIDDDLYQWTVKLTNFEADSELHAELGQVQQKHGYNYIELNVSFEPSYPYYPPVLRVVRPKFKGLMEHMLANFDLLKLSHWNPAKSMHEFLGQIKLLLQKHARIDIDAEANDLSASPDGSYTPLENYLMQFAATTEVRPRAVYELSELYSVPKAPPINYVSKHNSLPFGKGDEARGWAKGTGYASVSYDSKHPHLRAWQPVDFMKAQREQHRKEVDYMRRIIDCVTAYQLCEDARQQHKAVELLAGSCLVPFVVNQLKQDSFVEMEQHGELYETVVQMCECLSAHSLFVPLVTSTDCRPTNATIASALTQAAANASKYLYDLEVLQRHAKKSKHDLMERVEAGLTETIARRIMALERKVRRLAGPGSEAAPSGSGGDAGTSGTGAHQEGEADYVAALKHIQFAQVNFPAESAGPMDALPSRALKAIVREWTSLRNALPLRRASSVFVRVDESKLYAMQALIIGPEGTPYQNGCFLFTITFPESYPSSPPLVKLLTTGAGKVRFNPNLYNCGKVCLSLLNTWSGAASEQWNPETSSVLQVLISIQSLILIPDPYFNEPGFEASRGTPAGESTSEKYNQQVRLNCLKYAVLEQMKKPPSAFEEVINKHYRLKRNELNQQLDDWIKMDKSVKSIANDIRAKLKVI